MKLGENRKTCWVPRSSWGGVLCGFRSLEPTQPRNQSFLEDFLCWILEAKASF